jgi:AraC family transcriptional regulator of adaptative response/methylated-DNA-[protein]-cysteine methyltransferase
MSKENNITILRESRIDTPLGEMVAIADQGFLYLLEFAQSRGLQRKKDRLCKKLNTEIMQGIVQPIASIKDELSSYFSGKLKQFKTPIYMIGTSFQRKAWDALRAIPYAETRSYKQQADIIKEPLAHRAIANANASNQLAIIIPCHRIIRSDGSIGGYAGGISCKKWLLAHEQTNSFVVKK